MKVTLTREVRFTDFYHDKGDVLLVNEDQSGTGSTEIRVTNSAGHRLIIDLTDIEIYETANVR